MLSTDPSYDYSTIARNLKMQILTVQRAQGNENKVFRCNVLVLPFQQLLENPMEVLLF